MRYDAQTVSEGSEGIRYSQKIIKMLSLDYRVEVETKRIFFETRLKHVYLLNI